MTSTDEPLLATCVSFSQGRDDAHCPQYTSDIHGENSSILEVISAFNRCEDFPSRRYDTSTVTPVRKLAAYITFQSADETDGHVYIATLSPRC